MADVTWFKVLTDIFGDDKIKIMQSMPEGDSLLVMWFKVLSQAGKTNDGGYIYLRKNIPYTPSMLATLFNKPQMIVELALKTFEQFEMIDIDENGYIFVTNWEKHQNIEGMDKVREQNRLRNKVYRDKKRLELMPGDVTTNVTNDVTRRSNDGTELEVDLELEKTYSTDDFQAISVRFREIHGLLDFPYQDGPLLTDLLKEGISRMTIIKTIEKKFKPTATTLRYYSAAIREAHTGVVAVRKIKKYDAELESRNEEIARNQWIAEGKNPDEFRYKPASGD